MKNNISLKQENLKDISPEISKPNYDRSQLKAGIVHIGVGGFHRSHGAYYTHKLLDQGSSLDWGICGIGLREGDRKMGEILKAQDYLYTLIIRHPNGEVENKVIGSIMDFMLSVDDPLAVIDKMAHEDTKIVSLTITEGGYNFHPVSGEFMFDNPDIVHDLKNPESPRLVFGYLTAALKKRRDASQKPFTVQSCDNIPHNGNMTRKMLLAYAEKQDSELAEWIAQNVSFPNAMVDRITPVTSPQDIEYLKDEMQLEDAWPVTSEPFLQWVVEDEFTNGRPQWEKVGAQFVEDVTPYEKMKIRLLNAGHSVLGLLGSIHGYNTIDETVSDPLFSKYLRNYMDLEASPILDTVKGIDLDSYKSQLIERFGNPNIKDSLTRICQESSAKLPKFMIPTINENIRNKGSIQYAALVIAAWCYYSDVQLDQRGKSIEITDELKDELYSAASKSQDDILSFLSFRAIFGDLIDNEAFTKSYSKLLQALYNKVKITQLMEEVIE